jgi:DNA invertase Pin-like site-specific DNA recombinase
MDLTSRKPADAGNTLIPAAQYVRMSTEHQKYSPENQSASIAAYAHRNGLTIVRTYSDHGKSGLRLDGRKALKQLIADVCSGNTNFKYILVLDVSRWGRFQDADESAYYEYICKAAGLAVRYCAEPFENDGSLLATLLKNMKRLMAGEYSRELSGKVFAAQSRLAGLGFKQGSAPGYGFRRLLTDENGSPKVLLEPGQRKSLLSDKVILVHGPDAEVSVVRDIFRRFIRDRNTRTEIARILNQRGIANEMGRPWTHFTINQILTNEKYIGNVVYNRRSFKLRQKHINNPPEAWIRAEGAFKPLIDKASFRAAQKIVKENRTGRWSSEEMLARLRVCLANNARLSCDIINATAELPSSRTYKERFESIERAYQLVGYSSGRPCRPCNKLQGQALSIRWGVIRQITEMLSHAGRDIRVRKRGGHLVLDGATSISVNVASCRATGSWDLCLSRPLADITVATRLEKGSTRIMGYYLLPRSVLKRDNIRLASANGSRWKAYRVDSLDGILSLVGRPKRRSIKRLNR